MACTDKQDLLDLSQKEYGKLNTLISPLSAAQASMSLEHNSIKDTIGHRAHWIKLFLGWYADGMAGKKVYFPAKGYKWNDLKRYNADLRRRQADMDWLAACSLLQQRHEQLIAFVTQETDETLYGGTMRGANNKWTPGRWAEAAGPSHYRSAAKFIRSVLRNHA
ncbi:MAG: ClbS/DfsB family four-helix bundle protein [Paracoccaceae bacterium]|nr:ClbS/DfsB family four-helix bundle protein [Paracoccaceae bacterium]